MRPTRYLSLRFLRHMLLVLAIFTLAIGIVSSGAAWLLVVPAMYGLGRLYGERSAPDAARTPAEYGVGAALTGFSSIVKK